MKNYMVKELCTKRDNNRIYGEIYIPQDAGKKMPAVILSHGYGGDCRIWLVYAAALAREGYVVYCFDFCGGGNGSRSDGSTLEMSIFTERSDLQAVISMLKEQEYVDADALFLLGESQGGVVSAITAAANPQQIRGMILFYPAFVLVDDAKRRFTCAENVPDTYEIMGTAIGRAYSEKLFDYDVFEEIGAFKKDVLLIHGDADNIVPLSYSQRAQETYAHARLEVISGAGHGFVGYEVLEAIRLSLDFLAEKNHRQSKN